MTIIIPYRNRPDHLAQFIPHTSSMMPDTRILIVEQAPEKEWNREKLFNVAVRQYPNDFYVFNDIDMLPLSHYLPRIGVTQLASSSIQKRDYLGG